MAGNKNEINNLPSARTNDTKPSSELSRSAAERGMATRTVLDTPADQLLAFSIVSAVPASTDLCACT